MEAATTAKASTASRRDLVAAPAEKKRRKETSSASPSTSSATAGPSGEQSKERVLREWIRARQLTEFDELSFGRLGRVCPMGQPRAGCKPPVLLDFGKRRAVKGPFSSCSSPLRVACLTRLAREALGLSACVPEMIPFVDSETQQVGLVSPMIGQNPGEDGATPTRGGEVCDNAARGMFKLHEYVVGDRCLEELQNPVEVLEVAIAKRLLGSSDNNTSNILVAPTRGADRLRGYGLDFGGRASPGADDESERVGLGWVFFKRPRADLLKQFERVAGARATQVGAWLWGLQSEDGLRRFRDVCQEYPAEIRPDLEEDSKTLQAFVAHFDRLRGDGQRDDASGDIRDEEDSGGD